MQFPLFLIRAENPNVYIPSAINYPWCNDVSHSNEKKSPDLMKKKLFLIKIHTISDVKKIIHYTYVLSLVCHSAASYIKENVILHHRNNSHATKLQPCNRHFFYHARSTCHNLCKKNISIQHSNAKCDIQNRNPVSQTMLREKCVFLSLLSTSKMKTK